MMTKTVVGNKVEEKRSKWTIFEELNDTNDVLLEAICILKNLKELLRKLPDKMTNSTENSDSLVDSVMLLDASINACLETTGVYSDEVELKLDEMQNILLHEEMCEMYNFSKLASEVKHKQRRVDALIATAEDEIYRFLESENLYTDRQKRDARIMELVFSS